MVATFVPEPEERQRRRQQRRDAQPRSGTYNPNAKRRVTVSTDWTRLRKYGVTPEQYANMLAAQDGVCAICKRPEVAIGSGGVVKSLAVDHSHTTSVVRGLLCGRCNTSLGWYERQMFNIHAYIAGSE